MNIGESIFWSLVLNKYSDFETNIFFSFRSQTGTLRSPPLVQYSAAWRVSKEMKVPNYSVRGCYKKRIFCNKNKTVLHSAIIFDQLLKLDTEAYLATVEKLLELGLFLSEKRKSWTRLENGNLWDSMCCRWRGWCSYWKPQSGRAHPAKIRSNLMVAMIMTVLCSPYLTLRWACLNWEIVKYFENQFQTIFYPPKWPPFPEEGSCICNDVSVLRSTPSLISPILEKTPSYHHE